MDVSFWAFANTWIGLVALVIGIFLALMWIIRKVGDMVGMG